MRDDVDGRRVKFGGFHCQWFGSEVGRDHALAWFKIVVVVDEAGGVLASTVAIHEEWGKLVEELVAGDASGRKLRVKEGGCIEDQGQFVVIVGADHIG